MILPCNYIKSKINIVKAFSIIDNHFNTTGEKYFLYELNNKLQVHPEKNKEQLKLIYPNINIITR